MSPRRPPPVPPPRPLPVPCQHLYTMLTLPPLKPSAMASFRPPSCPVPRTTTTTPPATGTDGVIYSRKCLKKPLGCVQRGASPQGPPSQSLPLPLPPPPAPAPSHPRPGLLKPQLYLAPSLGREKGGRAGPHHREWRWQSVGWLPSSGRGENEKSAEDAVDFRALVNATLCRVLLDPYLVPSLQLEHSAP